MLNPSNSLNLCCRISLQLVRMRPRPSIVETAHVPVSAAAFSSALRPHKNNATRTTSRGGQQCCPPRGYFRAKRGAAAPQVLLFVFDVDVLGVDDTLVLLGFGSGFRVAGDVARCRWSCVRLVEDLGKLVAGVGQPLVR